MEQGLELEVFARLDIKVDKETFKNAVKIFKDWAVVGSAFSYGTFCGTAGFLAAHSRPFSIKYFC